MSHASEVLEACILFLQRIAHRVASAVNRYGFGFYLNGLSASHGLDQLALYAYAGTRADFGKDTLGLLVLVNNYLYVLDCRSIVKGDECNLLVSSFCSYPAFCQDFFACLGLKQFFNLFTKYFHFGFGFLKSSPRFKGAASYHFDRTYSAFLAEYMILSAEHLLNSCFTSVTIPILTSWSALMLTVMN